MMFSGKKLATEQAEEPLTMALQYANIQKWGNLFVGIVAFGSVVAHTAVLLVFQLGQPRIFFSMARDGLLPPSFARVHPRFRTPHVTTILTGVAVGVCAMFTSIDEMVDLTNIGTLFAFILVCIGILILRWREPERPRSFRTPWVPVIPLLGVASCLARSLPMITWIRFGLWLLAGMVVYFFYGFRRSRLLG
jgi:APA family basic amino acid/polyamine antiporter